MIWMNEDSFITNWWILLMHSKTTLDQLNTLKIVVPVRKSSLQLISIEQLSVTEWVSSLTSCFLLLTSEWKFNFRSIWWSSQRHGKGNCLGTIQPRVPGRSSRDEGSSRRAATNAISTELTCFYSQPVDCSFKSVEIVVNDQYKTRFQVWLTDEVTEKIKRNETKNTKQETGFMIQGSVPLASKWQRNNNSTIKHVFNLFHNVSFHAQTFQTVVPIVFHSVGVAFGTFFRSQF